jgi:hypothetical protein
VTVAWHRLLGPEFLSHVLHASRHAEYSVPRELQGLARDEALAHLLETFSRHGSAPLRADIERHAEEVCTMFSQIHDIETLAARLQKYDGAAKWMG